MAPDVQGELGFPTLEDIFQNRTEAKEQAQASLTLAAERMKWYYNKHKSEVPFKVKDKVLLKGKDLKIKQLSAKLSAKNFGPYDIVEQVGPVNFRLQLPHQNKVHPVFHALKLIPYHEDEIGDHNPAKPPSIEVEGHDEFEVEKILNSKVYYGYVRYLVKWLGYDVSEATWEPVRNVKHCKDLLDAFHVAHPDAPQPISLTNPRPVHSQFNQQVWYECFAGAQP